MITFDIHQDLLPKKYRFSKADLLHLGRMCADIPKGIPGSIAIEFVTDDHIRKLNRMYRHKDSVTDVLSFTYELVAGAHLGDVVISYDQALRQAENGDMQLELMDLIVHGVLHVLGYDHERPDDAKIMFPLQDELVNTML